MSDAGTMYANAKALHELLQESRAENERLQDENERLRSCLSDSAENSKQIMHEAHVQEEENAKLRELVRRMFYAVHPADREKFLTNVAELGVEV